MAPFSVCQLSNASRRLSLSLLRQHQNKLAVSKRQPSPIRLLSLQQPRYLHTGDDAKSDESKQISSDIAAAEDGIKAHSSVETSNEAKSIADDSIKSSNDITGSPTPDLRPILSSDPRGETKIKPRPWSEEELAQLEEFVKRPYFSIDYMARRMDRYFSSVLDQLKEMEKQKGVKLLYRSRPKTPWHHNMDATPEQVAIFEAKQDDVQKRMEHIVETLMTLPKTNQWEEILKLKSASEWASAIMKLIPLRVWHILAADEPPSNEDYNTIPMVDPFSTTGVFAQITRRKLYIGYIDMPFGVLACRDQQASPHRHRGLKVPLVPVSLEMSKQLTYEEIVEQRYVLGLARAALAAWLGAFNYDMNHPLRQLYAWWEKDVDSSKHPFGSISCNPLEQKLTLPPTPEERAAKKAKLEERLKREAKKAAETEKEVKKRLWRESAKKWASEAKGEF